MSDATLGQGAALQPEALVAELTRMANALFQGGAPAQLAPTAGLATAPTAVASPAAPPFPVTPPNPGPSALALGAGGVSTSQSGPPTPGMLTAPPLASAPPPKEGDLRSIGAVLADPLHTQPVRLAEAPAFSPNAGESAPYFLALAGLPSASTLPPQGSLPGSALSGSQLPGGPPIPSASLPTGLAAAPPAQPALDASSGLPAAPGLASAGTPTTLPGTRSAASTSLPASSDSLSPSGTDFTPQLFAAVAEPVPEPRRGSGIFDPHAIKRDFPILQERVHGRQLVWLDNAATTQKPTSVIERLKYYYEHENSNIHRAAHTLAGRATDAYEAARQKVQRFLNAPSVKDVIFVRGATEGINLVAQSWGRRNVSAGDEIVITWLEHHANIVPWQQLAAEKGAKLRVAPVDSRGQVILEEYEKLLGPRTKLVAITQVSN
ncbi:MAG TPA: aminotransferase class V-fold PLP-dependent enzyme, partial [Polyangiaceae bacterium]